jgi:hypothetical protein
MATPFVRTESGLVAEQSAGSFLDYGLDWSDWLAKAPGDEITESTWVHDPGIETSDGQISGYVTSIWIKNGDPGQWYALENKIVTRDGRKDSRVCLLYVKPSSSAGSALFPSRLVALAKMRRDRLVLLANSIMPDLSLTDDFLWEKLLAAEAQVGHMLRVPLAPTHYFPREPSQQQVDALGGKPWAIDPPYDYNPADWYGDKWGLILTRHKPLQAVVGMKFVYPSPAQTIVDVPADWIRMDAKYGQVQLVPTGTAYQTLLGGLFMSHLSGGKTLPFTISLEYVAGLANVSRDYPDLIDAVIKLATIKIVEDGFMPQSGSISADGLSQSLSVDVSKYHDAVDRVINGEAGNGGLVARIHGIRAMVL